MSRNLITILRFICSNNGLISHVGAEDLLIKEQLLGPFGLSIISNKLLQPHAHVLEFKMGSYIVYVRKFFLGQSWTSFTHFTNFSIHKTKKIFQ